jgi:hypothetical protein
MKFFMKAAPRFNHIVERVYNLPLEDRVKLKTLLAQNIADLRRDEILDSYKKAQAEYKVDKLKSSSDTDELMKML